MIAAIDSNELSVETYRKNHRRTYIVNQDIRSVDANEFMQELGLQPGELDLLAACPPCQGFSTLRTMNGGRDPREPLNDLVLELIRFVHAFLPKAIMIENVPALMNDHRLHQIKQVLSESRYSCKAKILNAEHFGVPQRRRRLVLLGSRFGAISFPAPQKRRRTVAQAFRHLPSPNKSDDPVHSYNVRRSNHVLALIRQIPKDGGSRTQLPIDDQLNCHKGFDGFKDVYGRMAWQKPAPTITGGCINPSKGRFLHPHENRAITLREAAVLQGFPTHYFFDMSRGRYPAAEMIGNAFPPRFAEYHAREIHKHLHPCSPTNVTGNG